MKRTRFTLVELLVVIVIFVILAGMTFGVMRMVWQKNADAVTRATIGRIQGAMDEYYRDYGYYPQFPDTNGDGSPDLPATTNINGHRLSAATVDSWKRKVSPHTPYLDVSKMQVVGGYVVDYWKQPLLWRSPGLMNPQKYDIWSTGKNKVSGNGSSDLRTALTRDVSDDDICNWR